MFSSFLDKSSAKPLDYKLLIQSVVVGTQQLLLEYFLIYKSLDNHGTLHTTLSC